MRLKLRLLDKVIMALLIIFVSVSCSSMNYAEKMERSDEDFSELDDIISSKSGDTSNKTNNFIDEILRAKVKKIGAKIRTKIQSKSFKKTKKLQEETGISSFKDTIPGQIVHSLKSEKCSSLKERKLLIRNDVTNCVKKSKSLPRLHFLYSIARLRLIDDNCDKASQSLEKKLKLPKARDCYLEMYKGGKFISPLNIIR